MMEKPFSDDSSHKELSDSKIDLGMIKEEHFGTLYYIKTELVDDENASLPFICDDKESLDVKPCVFSCTACNMKFSELEAIEKHFAAHETDHGHVCALCDNKFLHEYHFKLHLDHHME